ncbi:hypothetical protein BRAS3843_1340044 [Bradyrhizobium sp. STM 3843]|nr:hypothetical protein BRAS3843_1340044 [Bradyrhizobium sp. STM 3843]
MFHLLTGFVVNSGHSLLTNRLTSAIVRGDDVTRLMSANRQNRPLGSRMARFWFGPCGRTSKRHRGDPLRSRCKLQRRGR